MFDFLKNLTKSDEEKRQEAFSAYLDNSLSPRQRQEFELLLAEDADLRTELELAQVIRQQMSEMPRRSLPRSFTLDASVYGAPQKEPLVQAYPFLRVATVMTAFFFVFALGLSVFTSQSGGDMAYVAQTAMESAPAFDAPMAEAEIAMEDAAEEPLSNEKTVEAIVEVEEELAEGAAVEEEVAEEELVGGALVGEEAEEMPAAMVPLPTMTLSFDESTELGVAEESAMEADDMADVDAFATETDGEALPSASIGAVGGGTSTYTATPAYTPTPMPTATVSSLPRPDVMETAVPRVIEPPPILSDEVANAVNGETAVAETSAYQEAPSPSRSLTTSQLLLIGLGILLLLLVVVTLLARRKI